MHAALQLNELKNIENMRGRQLFFKHVAGNYVALGNVIVVATSVSASGTVQVQALLFPSLTLSSPRDSSHH